MNQTASQQVGSRGGRQISDTQIAAIDSDQAAVHFVAGDVRNRLEIDRTTGQHTTEVDAAASIPALISAAAADTRHVYQAARQQVGTVFGGQRIDTQVATGLYIDAATGCNDFRSGYIARGVDLHIGGQGLAVVLPGRIDALADRDITAFGLQFHVPAGVDAFVQVDEAAGGDVDMATRLDALQVDIAADAEKQIAAGLSQTVDIQVTTNADGQVAAGLERVCTPELHLRHGQVAASDDADIALAFDQQTDDVAIALFIEAAGDQRNVLLQALHTAEGHVAALDRNQVFGLGVATEDIAIGLDVQVLPRLQVRGVEHTWCIRVHQLAEANGAQRAGRSGQGQVIDAAPGGDGQVAVGVGLEEGTGIDGSQRRGASLKCDRAGLAVQYIGGEQANRVERQRAGVADQAVQIGAAQIIGSIADYAGIVTGPVAWAGHGQVAAHLQVAITQRRAGQATVVQQGVAGAGSRVEVEHAGHVQIQLTRDVQATDSRTGTDAQGGIVTAVQRGKLEVASQGDRRGAGNVGTANLCIGAVKNQAVPARQAGEFQQAGLGDSHRLVDRGGANGRGVALEGPQAPGGQGVHIQHAG